MSSDPDFSTMGVGRGDPRLPLPDVPLVAEDLLRRARQLADAGAPAEAVKPIFDHVAELREGRG